jgi:hypothetical protein
LVNTIPAVICNILFSVTNIPASGLPTVFDQTSTGGLRYVPGARSPRTTQSSSSGLPRTNDGGVKNGPDTRAESGIDSRVRKDYELAELSKEGIMFSIFFRLEGERGRTTLHSDATLARRSVDIR